MNEHPDTTQRDEQVGRLLDTVELDHGPAYWDTVRSATGPHLAKLRRRPLWARRPVQVGVAVAVAAAVVTIVLIGLPSRNGGTPTPANAAQLMLAAMDNGLLNTTTVQGDFSETTTVDASGHAPAWAEWQGSFAADAAGDSRYEIALAGRSAGVGVVTHPSMTGPPVPSSDRPNAIWAVLPPARYVSVYDASAMAVRWASWDASGKLTDHGSATRWPTFRWGQTPDDLLQFWVNNLSQAALVQAAVAGAADLPVRAVIYDGRPAWQATVDLLPTYQAGAHYFSVLREVVTVDQANGFVVHTVLSATPGPAAKTPGYPYALSPYTIDLRITHLKTDSALPTGTFTELPQGVPNPAPSGAAVTPNGSPPVTAGTLAQAAASAGFKPLTPARLPAGFVLSAASGNARMGISSMISQFMISPREVDQLYRRGFEWFELDVTPWNGENRDQENLDLRILKEVELPKRVVVVLHGGSQAGATAYLWQGSGFGNAGQGRFSDHGMLPLWASSTLQFYGKGYCVYLWGNIPSKDLLRIADSLRVAK